MVRAAAESEIPLISAVGHETDTTLIDHASARRAPTPTAAAEMAVPVRLDLASQVEEFGRRQDTALRRRLEESRHRVEGLARGLRGPRELLGLASQRFDDLAERLPRALSSLARERHGRLRELAAQLRPRLLAGEVARQGERLAELEAARAAGRAEPAGASGGTVAGAGSAIGKPLLPQRAGARLCGGAYGGRPASDYGRRGRSPVSPSISNFTTATSPRPSTAARRARPSVVGPSRSPVRVSCFEARPADCPCGLRAGRRGGGGDALSRR